MPHAPHVGTRVGHRAKAQVSRLAASPLHVPSRKEHDIRTAFPDTDTYPSKSLLLALALRRLPGSHGQRLPCQQAQASPSLGPSPASSWGLQSTGRGPRTPAVRTLSPHSCPKYQPRDEAGKRVRGVTDMRGRWAEDTQVCVCHVTKATRAARAHCLVLRRDPVPAWGLWK